MNDPRIEAAALEEAADVIWMRANAEYGVCDQDRETDSYTKAEEVAREVIGAYLAAADKAMIVTTMEELDALPNDSVILADSVAYQKCGDHWDGAARTWDAGQLVRDLPAQVLHYGATK